MTLVVALSDSQRVGLKLAGYLPGSVGSPGRGFFPPPTFEDDVQNVADENGHAPAGNYTARHNGHRLVELSAKCSGDTGDGETDQASAERAV